MNMQTQPIIIKNATFITSAARAEQFIRPDKPMIAVCGKSNVGKSSFINMLANRKKLAKTSSEPGRTRLVNYFDFGEFILADSRHDPTADDVQMVEYLHYNTIPFTVTLTKADKLSKMKLKEHIRAIAADLYLGVENLLATSAETGYGKTEVLQKIAQIIQTANTLPTDGEIEENEENEEDEEEQGDE